MVKEKCDDLAGNVKAVCVKDVCAKEAKAAEVQLLAGVKAACMVNAKAMFGKP